MVVTKVQRIAYIIPKRVKRRSLHSYNIHFHKMILIFFYCETKKTSNSTTATRKGKNKKLQLEYYFIKRERKSRGAMLICDLIWHHCSVSRGSSITGMICVCVYKNGYIQIHICTMRTNTHLHRYTSTAACLWFCAKIQLSSSGVVFIAIVNLSMLFLIFLCFSA